MMNIKNRNIGFLLLLGFGTISPANAYDNQSFGLSINLGGPAYYARPEVYYEAHPVYVERPHVIYYDQHVVRSQPYYYDEHGRGHAYGHHKRHHHDHDDHDD